LLEGEGAAALMLVAVAVLEVIEVTFLENLQALVHQPSQHLSRQSISHTQ
jgi:hypothetical protein